MQCGCYAQVAKKELEKIEEIDLILGVNEKRNIVKYIEKAVNEKVIKISDVSQDQEFADFGAVTYTEKTRAVIKVQDGCNQFCTYCIIPYARGRIRSRKPDDVIKEIKEISKKGIKEVVITGIHLASYGKDFNEETLEKILKYTKENIDGNRVEYNIKRFYLIDLLEEIQKIKGIERIRLGSLEPTLITNQFVERLRKLSKICDQFHLSLQSGCNDTLKRMNRKYTTEKFFEATQILRNTFKQVHLTTDIIVGFPGEIEKEFEETYKFLKKVNFYKMHIFKYSPRKGTLAANMTNQIDGNIKEKRSNELIKLSDENETNYQKQYIGKQLEVLFEEKEGSYWKGHTTNYMIVKVKTEQNLENKIQNVKILEENKLELVGIISPVLD